VAAQTVCLQSSDVRLAIFHSSRVEIDNLRPRAATQSDKSSFDSGAAFMRLRGLWIGLCLLITSSAALAQSRGATPTQAAQPNDIRERVCTGDAERMRWEAAQMWGMPAIPNQSSEADHHAVHIEQVNQPAVPKLRREWLTASSESAMYPLDKPLVETQHAASPAVEPLP
jgi:hypothetical protein